MSQILGAQLGRYVESIAAMETAVRLDPLSIIIGRNYINELINRNRLVEADQELEKLASMSPGLYILTHAWRTSLGGKWANAILGTLDYLQSVDNSATLRTVLALQFAVIGLDKEALDVAGAAHFGVLRILGRPDDAIKTVEMGFARNSVDPRIRRDQELALAGSGDYARAWPILEEKWLQSGGRITCCRLFRIESAAALITIRRDADEDNDSNELLAAIRDNVRRLREAGMTRARLLIFSVDFEEGLAAYLAGKREKGLALIARAAEDGYFILPGEAYLQTLYDDPEFAPIRVAQEARQTRERKKFLTIVCTDNPYADVWQPAEGTCERFAAEGGR